MKKGRFEIRDIEEPEPQEVLPRGRFVFPSVPDKFLSRPTRRGRFEVRNIEPLPEALPETSSPSVIRKGRFEISDVKNIPGFDIPTLVIPDVQSTPAKRIMTPEKKLPGGMSALRILEEQGSPDLRVKRKTKKPSPKSSPSTSPKSSPRSSRKSSPKSSPRSSRKSSPKSSPRSSRKSSPKSSERKSNKTPLFTKPLKPGKFGRFSVMEE
jgi:hypothetical protein